MTVARDHGITGYGIERSRFNKFGLTPQVAEDMLLAQKDCCAICMRPLKGKEHLDHDHDTGLMREFLCGNCNAGLGMFKDSIRVLAQAIVYLEKHGKSFKTS